MSLRPGSLTFDPRPRCLSTPTDAFQLHPDVRSYGPLTLSVNPASRVFCNRSLNMANIAAVGFDMDYTLAMYKPETFEVLAYESACKKLVEVYGYPEEITAFRYDHAYMVRGLVVDKKRGCLLYTSPSPRDQRGSRMPSSA